MNREIFKEVAFFFLRVVTGLLLFHMGALKLYGWFGGSTLGRVPGWDTVVGGYLEFYGGLLILFGLFTRPTAFLLCGMMAVIYFWKHFTLLKFWPIENRGDKAVIFCFVFLLFWAYGAGKWSIDHWILKRQNAKL
jgi:putative oxidoreductase